MESKQQNNNANSDNEYDSSDNDGDISQDKVFHFYWITNKTEVNQTFGLKIRGQKLINMKRLEDNIFYAETSISNEEIKDLNEIKYSFVKFEQTESLDQNEESEQERTKGKKFLKLSTFFDSQQTKKFSVPIMGKGEIPEHFIRFLIKNSNKSDMHFGQPQIFHEYLEFLKEDSATTPYNSLFKMLTNEYQTRMNENSFNLYIIELISFFDSKTIQKKKKYFLQLANEMQKQSLGYFRKLIPMESLKNQNAINLIKGLQNLIVVNPLLGLEFFNDPQIIFYKLEYVKTINLKDDYNFMYTKHAIKQCFNELNFTKKELGILIEYVLCESKDLEIFLTTVEELISKAETESIEASIKNLIYRFQQRQWKDFVKVNLERVISIKSLKKVLKQQIQDQIYVNLKNIPHISTNLQFLLSNPDLIDYIYLNQIVQIKNNLYLQQEYKRLILSFLTNTTKVQDFQELKEVLLANFNNLVSNQQSFVKCHYILCDFIELTNESCFQKVHQFQQSNILKALKKNLALLQQQYQIQFLLAEINIVLSQQDNKHTNHLIEVALDIITKQDVNENTIKLMLDKLFVNDKLQYDELRPISDFIFSKKLVNIKQLKPQYMFDDALLYQALRISMHDNNEYLRKLNENVVMFLQKIKDKSILLKDVNLIIANKKKYLESMLKIVDPQFNVSILDELVNINKQFKQNVEKHQTFLLWASKSNIAVDVKNYDSQINKLNLGFENMTASKAISNDQWIYFQKFNTIEKYYHFKDSELFEKLFLTMSQTQENGKNLFAADDDRKNSVSLTTKESMVRTISMSQFDKASQEILFDKICREHFNQLMKYPKVSFKQDTLQRYWQNIQSKKVLIELTYVLDYELNIMNNKDAQLTMELTNHLQKYGNQFIYFQQAMTLITLEGFARKQQLFNIDEDECFIKLKNYVEFVSQRSHEIDLQIIAQEVEKVEDIFKQLEENDKVKIEILEELSRSRDTFEFSIANIGLDFNDLFENLDEESFITNATISDMNSVSNYLSKLYDKIQNLNNENNFLKLLEFFSIDLHSEMQIDPLFKSKLQNCNINLSAIKQISDATKNVAENTLNIIADSLNFGVLKWTKEKDKYDYALIVNHGDGQEELKKDNPQNHMAQHQSQQQQQYHQVIYDQDKVNQHCSRGILLIHSKKTSPDSQKQTELDVNLFAQVVKYAQEISNLIKGLSQYGRVVYKEETLQESLKIKKISVRSDLKQMKKDLKKELIEWKERLSVLRNTYYFLNFVPNSMIADLIDAFENPTKQTLQYVIQKFKQYKMLDNSISDDILFVGKAGNLYESFQEIWTQYLVTQEDFLKLKIDKITTQYQLSASKVQYRFVNDDLHLIKAIISLFTISGILPQSTNILFCTEQTQINEIETFVMRAMLCNKQIKRKKLFLIANFQKLNFNTQFQSFDFIKSQESQEQKNIDNQFYLYLISTCQEIKSAHLIEEVRTCSQYFQQMIREDQIKEVFKKFDWIKVVKSEQCGHGKSEFIRSQVLNKNTKKKNEQLKPRSLVRIPIYGELNRKKLIELHKLRISEKMNDKDQPSIAIHYDIYPTSKEELNVIMFELLILGSLNDYQNNTFYLPNNIKVYVEISQSLNNDFIYLFFGYLKNQDIKWDYTNIKVGNTKDDKVQKVCRYLYALEDVKYKPEMLIDPPKIFSEIECQHLLRKYFISRLNNPNFYYINSFITFVADQLNKMENSTFFIPEFLYEQMSGFFEYGRKKKGREIHKEIVKQLIQLALKISIVEKYQEQNEISQGIQKKTTQEEQANRFKDLQWDVYNNPFIVFNDSGTITPIYRNIEKVPRVIQEYQERTNKKDKEGQHFKNYDEMTNDDFIDKILEICVDEGQKEKLRKQKDLKNIVFTLDNFMKLVLIYLRIRAFQPIILMGETGVGKTSLVEYLAKIIDAEFRVLNVHAGIGEEDIIRFVEDAQIVAKEQDTRNKGEAEVKPENKRKIILFFDEINTNYNISGLLKEIFIDRHINGCPLEKNICLVSACNPYQLRKQEISSQTSGIKMDKDTTISKLVYRVLPLPESMIPYIWDYKSLNEGEETKYITKMVEKTYENAKIIGKGISLVNLWIHRLETEKQKVLSFNQEIQNISMVVQRSQIYIKKEEDSPWAVSLRDVSRFCKLFIYFNNNNVTLDRSQYIQPEIRKYSSRDIALVLSVYFCYVIRISVQKERIKYINYLSQLTMNSEMEHLDAANFKVIVNKEQDRFLDCMELKPGIGKNAPLKENIFVMITCILNQIPLIITGKPGSSKTLAMNLIHKSFKGNISSKEFFKKFPAFLPFYYQGSEQSTSKGIERIYKKAHKTQKKVREKNTQVVVIFDEIGLAEKSIHNPLKVLHSLLEPPKVSTVGISNWSLDASKMNRVITLSRTDPDSQDLLESAKSIAQGCHPIFQQKYLKNLVDWYIYYISRQENTIKCKNFHGLRDFYSMIKFISKKISADEELNEFIITHGIQRNFGGSNQFDLVVSTLELHLQLKNQDLLKKVKPDKLIKDNLSDYDTRHLMIITDNFENTLQFIQDECQINKRPYEIFYGSDFPDDQNEESIYKQINEIILQMENGTLCIFLNLNSIYQSFYDMLNQNYQDIGTQKFCKVAIGPDSSRCLVHENFKCILIVDQSKIDDLDPPLLNRFEKQLFTEDISIDQQQKTIISKVNGWINNLQIKNFSKKQMFPTLDELQSLQQLIIQNKEFYDESQIEQECKRSLIRVATFQGIIRSLDSQAADRQEWYNEYMKVQYHFNLHGLLSHYLEHYNDESEKCFKSTMGFNLIVYSFYAMIKLIESDSRIKEIQFQEPLINLSSIHKKKQFQQKIEDFFSINNTNRLLLIYADMFSDSKNRINLCRSIINNQRTKRLLDVNKQEGQQIIDKHICFIIRIDQHKEDQNISFGKDWRQYSVDLLNGKGQSDITVEQLINNDFETLLKGASSQTSLFETSIVESMSKIYYNKNQEFIRERIQEIQKLFLADDNIDYLKQLILLKVKQNDNFESINSTWRLQVVKNEFLMKSNLTFHGAALEYIKTELVKYLAFIIFYLEQDGIINAYKKQNLFQLAKKYFQNLFQNTYINNRIQDMYFLAQNFDRIKFPLARLIHQQFMQLKIQYIKILKEQTLALKENDLDDEELEMMMRQQTFTLKDQEEEKEERKNAKSLKQDRERNEKLKKMIVKDRQLSQNITNLDQWCKIYFPQDYIDQNILSIENQTYSEDFSYLLDNQDIITTNSFHQEYNQFITTTLTIIMKEKFESKSQIYGVYWKYENLLTTVWKIIKDNIKLFKFDKMIEKLKQENIESPDYKRQELTFLPREAFIQCLIKVFYDLYYPSEALKGRFTLWEQNVKQTFQKLNDLAFSYLGVMTTHESRVIIFLLKFNQEIINKSQTPDKEKMFIGLAQSIKEIFNEPQKVINEIFILRDQLVKDQNQQQRALVNKKIFKFIFEYIIDADCEGDTIDLEFMLDKIVILFIQSEHQEQQLQNDEKFKFLMLRIIYIALYQDNDDDEEDTCQYLQYIDQFTKDTFDLKEFLEENDFLESLENYLQDNNQLKNSDPFIIALTDQIEENLEEEQCCDLEYLNQRFIAIQRILLDDKSTMLQKIISTAFFKKVVSYYCSEVSLWMAGTQQYDVIDFHNAIDKFFDVSGPDKVKFTPFLIYIVKLLYQQQDVLKVHQNKLLEKNKFIRNYLDLKPTFSTKSFSFINHEEYKQFRNDSIRLVNNMDELIKLNNLAPFRKFCILVSIIEQTYLQNRTLDANQQQKLLGNLEGDQMPGNAIVNDKYTRDFLVPFCTNQFEQYQKRNKFIRIENDEKVYYFKMIQMFVGSAALSGNSFLSEFFTNPKNIKDYFVPFVQNTKEDYDYQQKLKNNEHVRSLQCQSCKFITLVVELTTKPNDQSKLQILGEKQCQYCKVNEKGEKNRMKEYDKAVYYNNKLSTDEMAIKSYVIFEMDSYNDLKIRNLTELELAVGRIILHSLLMLSLCFSDQETEIFAMILSDYPYSNQKYGQYVTRTIQYLTRCFQLDWNNIKSCLSINDEKILQIIEYIIIDMLKNINRFKCELLGSIRGRIEFEIQFTILCQSIFKDLGFFFNQSVGYENEIEKLLLESNPVNDQDFYHLMRIKRPISIKQFEKYLVTNNREDINFFKLLFEQKESIQSIQYLKPLVQWAKYIFTKWNAQLTYDEANELEIKDIIQKENDPTTSNKDYVMKIEKDFAKFQQAWNKFAGLIIRDQNVEVTIPVIAQSSKLIFCCISSDKCDQPGHIFYLLLKYLSQKQNRVLDEATKMVKQKQQKQQANINGISFPQVSILDLRKDQIIQFREKPQIKYKRKYTQINNEDSRPDLLKVPSDQNIKEKEKEKFEGIIIDNSACNLKYGQGKIVEFNIEQIKSSSVELLLQGKYMIDLEQKHNFQFVNIGNLYSQFEDIQKKIEQENAEELTKSILDRKTIEEIHLLLGQLRVTMNFIQNSQISKDKDEKLPNIAILEFMKALKIIDNDKHLEPDLKLKHIISFYEAVEELVENIEVEKINVKYQVLLNQKESLFKDLGRLINERKNEVEKLMHIIGRLCIRQLRNFQKEIAEQNLFKFLASSQNQQLYSKFNEKNVNYEEISQILGEFINTQVEIKHAKEVYTMFRQQFEKMIKDQRDARENEQKRIEEFKNQKELDDIELDKIIQDDDQPKVKKPKPKKDKKQKKGAKNLREVQDKF